MENDSDPAPSKRVTSSDLLYAVQSGDEGAFAELNRRYGRRLEGWIRRLIRQPDLVEEGVQETWLRLLKATPKIPLRFASFVLTVATYAVRNLLERDWRERLKIVGDSPYRPASEPVVEPEVLDQLIVEERKARIWSVARTVLPEKQREVLWLREHDGLTDSEICRRLGLSRIDERVSLCRARQRVRQVVAEASPAPPSG